jgi:hypothetical protein
VATATAATTEATVSNIEVKRVISNLPDGRSDHPAGDVRKVA